MKSATQHLYDALCQMDNTIADISQEIEKSTDERARKSNIRMRVKFRRMREMILTTLVGVAFGEGRYDVINGKAPGMSKLDISEKRMAAVTDNYGATIPLLSKEDQQLLKEWENETIEKMAADLAKD